MQAPGESKYDPISPAAQQAAAGSVAADSTAAHKAASTSAAATSHKLAEEMLPVQAVHSMVESGRTNDAKSRNK